jgi:hypothetical protein
MGNSSKKANWEYNRKSTTRNTNFKKWNDLLKHEARLSPEFAHQVRRNLAGAKKDWKPKPAPVYRYGRRGKFRFVKQGAAA